MAQPSTVRIDKSAHQMLRQLSETMGEPMSAVLTKAIEELRRKRMFDDADSAFVAMRNDATSWSEETKERNISAGTLADDLDSDEEWTEDGRLLNRA